jgi:pimeloyl-ACP methyl ester carboxylesterase
MYQIESLLSARQFLVPQVVGGHIYFVSNMSGRLSLYRMKTGGSLPEPLLPPEISLQNPHLMPTLYRVIPSIGKILLMLDHNGDENYKPMTIPMDGGYPEPLLDEDTADFRYFIDEIHLDKNLLYLDAASHKEAMNYLYQVDLGTGEKTLMWKSKYGGGIGGLNADHSKAILLEGYSQGDIVLRTWEAGRTEAPVLRGIPMDERPEGYQAPLENIYATHFVRDESHLVFFTSKFDDTGGIGWLDLANPDEVHPGTITGVRHEGLGEFEYFEHTHGNEYLAHFNIDGSDWVYRAELDEETFTLGLKEVLVGQGELSDGVLESFYHDKETGVISLSFSTAVSPTQLYTIAPDGELSRHTNERLLGIPDGLLSKGEDYPFTSHDGLRCSARLYLPNESLGFEGPRPLVYYVHGGPQGQERPDFAWFSMPLIQFLTLNGFAVFVPNVRGSTGYGLSYTKRVDRDWGGEDRLDHVHAMTEILPKDDRVDTSRAAVVGRSYGGYMTLTLAARHPELWKASCDMFGPYDLFTFLERIPATWKPYFHIALGHPEKDVEFLTERSPKTYIDQIAAPMLVIQGKNDPRVIEQESADVVAGLQAKGKDVEYLMFENEGHDVIKFENKVRCYNAITDFFAKHLQP